MTEKLRTLMDEVTGMVDQEFALPDLEAITAAGDRTVRRRRIAVGAVGLALAGGVTVGALVVGGGPGDDRAEFSDDPFATDVPVWALGSTLHTPTATHDLGVEVRSLVRTVDGVAFIGADDGVYTFDGERAERIGTAAEVELSVLVGDADGAWVGWLDDSGEQRDFVAHDVVSGVEVREPVQFDPGAEEPLDTGLFLAIDGSTAYWTDVRGTTATDLEAGTSRLLGEPGEPVLVVSAESGTTVRWRETATGGDLGTDVVDPDGRVLLGYRQVGTAGALSPDGRWITSLDTAQVWGVATGEVVRLETDAPLDAIAYEWLGSDAVMVLAEVEGEDDALRLMRCAVPAGSCEDVATARYGDGRLALPSFGLMPLFVFGSGGEDSAESQEASGTERSP